MNDDQVTFVPHLGCLAEALTSRKVLRPMARLSDAPMRVCTASNTCMRARSAGTKEPTCRPVINPSAHHATMQRAHLHLFLSL